MLSPDDRTLLVDLLAPPEAGFRLRHAVATTFTLHLTALLPIPLGLAGADLSTSTDPLSILQAIRNYSDRIDVFCQAGHVSVPSQRNDLLAFLEPMIHQVKAPRPGHLFHPKLWVLRFTNDNDDGDELYRLVCGSRNLTDDHAWDVVINLEGRRTLRRHAVNRPIADLLTSLAGRVPAGVPADRRAAINELAQGVRFVEWERPDNVIASKDWLAFHLFGSGRTSTPNMAGYNRLVVSPFLNDAGLEAAWPEGEGDCVLISRSEELNALGDEWRKWLEEYANLRVLDETAAIPDLDSDEAGLRWSLSSLHAKLYIVERNREAHVFLGSANTTGAAWGGNDELLVELVGRVGTYGVEATFGDSTGFGRILLPYILGDIDPETPEDELRRTFENALRELSALTYTATVEGEHERPMLWVRSDEPLRAGPSFPPDTELTVELLTITGQPHRPSLGMRLDHRWQLSEVEEITPFLIIRLASGKGTSRVEVGSVVLTRLVGDPADRLDRVLARRIGTTSEFLRFILLLLQLAGREGWFPEGQGVASFGAFGMGEGGSGLLEAVLTALASSPGTIDDIDRLVKRLTATEQGRNVLPEGWDAFWPPVVDARSRLGTPT